MAFQVLVTEIANEDLAVLVRYIARDNPAAAKHFGQALLEKLKLLREHPMLGRVLPERGEPNLRALSSSLSRDKKLASAICRRVIQLKANEESVRRAEAMLTRFE